MPSYNIIIGYQVFQISKEADSEKEGQGGVFWDTPHPEMGLRD